MSYEPTIRELIERQFSLEFDIDKDEFRNTKNVFTCKKSDLDFRLWARFKGDIVCYQDKVLFRFENSEVLKQLQAEFSNYDGQWFFEKNNLEKLSQILKKHGLKIVNRAPFFVPGHRFKLENLNTDFCFYGKRSIKLFQNDERIVHSFCYDDGIDEDKIGLAYFDGIKMVSISGASRTGKYMWEIGVEKLINDEKYYGKPSEIVHHLAARILHDYDNILPIYGTQFSHTKSMNTAIRAGFVIGWIELMISDIPEDN